jgi:murein DD-endopeptidase MepM/ murein hydrolase activator NlpD
MRRRRFLALIPAATALLVVRCGGQDERAIVRVNTRTPPPSPAASEPTPTPTLVPAPELVLSTEVAPQGGAILCSLVGMVTEGTVTFMGRTQPLTQGKRSIYAFVPVDIDDAPGVQPLRVDFTLVSGSKGSLTTSITVERTSWPVDEIVVPDVQQQLLDPAVSNDENLLLRSVYSQVTPVKFWDGPWLVPAPGEITTQFGEQRSYNGGPPLGHHSGTDIGSAEGNPVIATNHGRVVLARQLRLRGNMVIVDHGGGLFSGYAHLSAFGVGEGQLLAAGEQLGQVGSTGLSTGAHLHWEMAAGGVLVDALRFANGSNGF